MGYLPKNLILMVPRLGTGDDSEDAGAATALWSYRSSADNVATMIGAGYISDGKDRGIKINDTVIVIDDLATMDLCIVTVVSDAGLVTMVQLA